MKVAIAKEHRDFFKKNGWIEFENLFNKDQFTQLKAAIDQTLAERLNIPVDKLFAASSDSTFMQGRDLWRSNETLRKLICLPRLGEIVAELVEVKPVRLGYDQFLPSLAPNKLTSPSSYTQFLQTDADLQSLSSIKGLIAGVLIGLNESKYKESFEGIDIYPAAPGNMTIFNPETPFDFTALTCHPKQSYYLIAYTHASSYYLNQPNDPHNHALKKLGYIFNSKLNDKFHPLVYR